MARLVLSTAGAIVGGAIGGPAGAKLGWLVGGAIGATFEPNQRSEGPRLGDLTVSGSSYGTSIPYVLGNPRVAGQIVWASAKREIATTQTQGKGGGGGQEYTSYTYEVDLLILLSDNIIAGVSRVWSNGTLVQNATTSSGKWSRLTSYTGAATQLPDPTYEAAVGTANAPAYRGRGSVFIQALQLGSSGQVPNLTFEIQNPSYYGDNASLLVSAFITRRDTNPGRYDAYDIAYTGVSTHASYFSEFGTDALLSANYWGTVRVGGTSTKSSTEIKTLPIDVYATYQVGAYAGFYAGDAVNFTLEFMDVGGTVLASMSMLESGAAEFAHRFRIGTSTPNTLLHENLITSAYITFKAGALVVTSSGSSGFDGVTGRSFSIGCAATRITKVRATVGVMKSSDYFTSDNPGAYARLQKVSTSTYVAEPEAGAAVSTSVARLCVLAGLRRSQFDTSALATITRPVRGMWVTPVGSARSVLELLARAYQFEAVLSDKIYFRPRAAAAAGSVAAEDLGWDGKPTFALHMVNDLEVPSQMAVSYADVGSDYQTDTQQSDRLLSGQESLSALQFPMGMTRSEAKTLADGLLTDKVVGMTSTSIAVGLKYAQYEPTDVLLVNDPDGNVWRMRVVKKTTAADVITLDLVLDDASVFTQAGAAGAGIPGQTVVNPAPTSDLLLLDAPLLNDSDNTPGHYFAIAGSGAGWASAALYKSAAATGYALNQTVLNSATLGVTTTALQDYSGAAVFDEASFFTVNVGTGQLASATRDAILNSQAANTAMVGSEVIQFRTALLVSAGVYTLSGLLRGRRGTEWAMTGHTASDTFCVLGLAGVGLVTLQSSELGKPWYYKAASAGQAISGITEKTITPSGVLLKPFSPVDCRANRAVDDTELTWLRRSRLSCRFTGALGLNVPLGEAAESYEVEVYSDGTYTTILRTVTALTSPAMTYTSAQQVTDFGSNQSVLSLKIFQLSATVGRGYPLTVSV